MRVEQINQKTEVIEYDSLQEFYNYLINTPFNEAFCWDKHYSVDGDYSFTKTKNFDEAVKQGDKFVAVKVSESEDGGEDSFMNFSNMK